jgi:hypothetical protein
MLQNQGLSRIAQMNIAQKGGKLDKKIPVKV